MTIKEKYYLKKFARLITDDEDINRPSVLYPSNRSSVLDINRPSVLDINRSSVLDINRSSVLYPSNKSNIVSQRTFIEYPDGTRIYPAPRVEIDRYSNKIPIVLDSKDKKNLKIVNDYFKGIPFKLDSIREKNKPNISDAYSSYDDKIKFYNMLEDSLEVKKNNDSFKNESKKLETTNKEKQNIKNKDLFKYLGYGAAGLAAGGGLVYLLHKLLSKTKNKKNKVDENIIKSELNDK